MFEGVRRVAVTLVGLWVGLFLARFVVGELIGINGTGLRVALCVFGALGLVHGVVEARGLQPMTPDERRKSILGWGFVLSLVPVGACLFIPLPWAAPAALIVALVCLSAVRFLAGRVTSSA